MIFVPFVSFEYRPFAGWLINVIFMLFNASFERTFCCPNINGITNFTWNAIHNFGHILFLNVVFCRSENWR